MTNPNTPQELPELPPPQGVLWSAIHSTMLNSGQFTVDQMRAYGQLCRDTAQAELAKAQEEIARLKERNANMYSNVMAAQGELAQLRATPTAPADLVEALRGAIRIMRDFDSGDPECEHGMFYDVCPNVECEKRDFHKVLESAKSALSRYEAAQTEQQK